MTAARRGEIMWSNKKRQRNLKKNNNFTCPYVNWNWNLNLNMNMNMLNWMNLNEQDNDHDDEDNDNNNNNKVATLIIRNR